MRVRFAKINSTYVSGKKRLLLKNYLNNCFKDLTRIEHAAYARQHWTTMA